MKSSLDVMCVQFIKSSANDVHDSTHICNICKKKKNIIIIIETMITIIMFSSLISVKCSIICIS